MAGSLIIITQLTLPPGGGLAIILVIYGAPCMPQCQSYTVRHEYIISVVPGKHGQTHTYYGGQELGHLAGSDGSDTRWRQW